MYSLHYTRRYRVQYATLSCAVVPLEMALQARAIFLKILKILKQ